VFVLTFSATSLPTLAWEDTSAACLVLTGLGGVPEYDENFQKWGSSIERICNQQVNASASLIDGRSVRRDEILKQFEAVSADSNQSDLWIFLIGHGTFDGRDYKFNIAGPDLTGNDLTLFLESNEDRRVFVVLSTSSSGALLSKLKSPERVVVSATSSGREKRPPLFMSFFVEGSESAEADRNKDGKVSLYEVFGFSETNVKQWYEEKGRLQTEHPVLEDPSGLANFAYLSTPPEQAYRSLEARQLAPEKTRLERETEDLKLRKSQLSASEYYQELERLLVELAELNEKIHELEGTP
jgi:hypothetical protein